jgi:parallel beta-helix repeat protein
MDMRISQRIVAAAAAVLVSGLSTPALAQSQALAVDCAKGQTIAKALSQGDERKPLVVTVRGTCNESVRISRDDVTLRGDPSVGGRVNGPGTGAITILANRITIDHLSVTGGGNGITVEGAFNAVIKNSVIEHNAQSGIHLVAGHARIFNNTIQYSGVHGVSMYGGNALLKNNQIQYNTVAGIHLEAKSSVNVDTNTIRSNGLSGIEVFADSYGDIVGNTITANGTDLADNRRRNGVHLNLAHAHVQNNSITNHANVGVFADASFVNVAGNTISGNHWGIYMYLGSILIESGDSITSNQSNGVVLDLNSTGQVGSATIQSNGRDGILLVSGSKLVLPPPFPSTIGGNGGYGLQCGDAESSWVGATPNFSPPNTLGTISATCTGY